MSRDYQNHEMFVLGLKSAFPYMTKDAVGLYTRKLSGWRLTKAQWESALDQMLQVESDGNPPQLSVIYAELKRQGAIARPAIDLGWAAFDLAGHSYAIRIRSQENHWVIADLTYKNQHGEENHSQPHYGEPLFDHIPANADNFVLTADNPVRSDNIPTKDEVSGYMEQIRINLSRLGVYHG